MPPPRKPANPEDPRAHLPLTNLAFHILLAVADRPRHGYGIILDIEERSGGAMRLRSGTLYTAIQRLSKDGLLNESKTRPPDHREDPRRRYYRITPLGRKVAGLEANRLREMLLTAEKKRLIDSSERA